ncbi:MAG: aldo/keto reductase [Candidatus Parabeggiatoa sp. nov. 3]|nr:MAG: aldo/keto reductase [Gammaproteobacteria bacterium]RKZ66484.1 MAG: aldo/keto reductase [Gammaproteobacteria bacterium]RKZ87489.1 MAG: aldo/keto reductase [Gammaproteobacteria bacterium]
MVKKTLGNNNELEVSTLCHGTDHFGSRVDYETSTAILDRYVAAGENFLDTSNFYAAWIEGFKGGESETLIGKWIKERKNRDQLIIATKVGVPYQDVPMGAKAKIIEMEAEKSLKRLGIDTIDMYYTHLDDRSTPFEEQLEAMDKLVKAGKVRCIGACNILAWRLEEARNVSLSNGFPLHSCVEQRYTYLRPKVNANFGGQVSTNSDLLDYCRSRNLQLIAYSPLLHGAYMRNDRPLPPQYQHADSDVRMEALKAVAEELNATLNQIVIAWLMHQNIIPIIGASRVEQIEQNLGCLDINLTEAQMKTLNRAGI